MPLLRRNVDAMWWLEKTRLTVNLNKFDPWFVIQSWFVIASSTQYMIDKLFGSDYVACVSGMAIEYLVSRFCIVNIYVCPLSFVRSGPTIFIDILSMLCPAYLWESWVDELLCESVSLINNFDTSVYTIVFPFFGNLGLRRGIRLINISTKVRLSPMMLLV